jgi:predicted nuclease with TOPRIM domain
MSDETAKFTVQMPKSLREDAKRNSDRGDLSKDVRKLFRRRAYGLGNGEFTTELEETQAELKSVRNELDDLRRDRNKLEAKIQSKEGRENRLKEKLDRLQQEKEDRTQTLNMLENMLHDGERIFMQRIKNYAEVGEDEAVDMLQQLKDRNPDVPEKAFELSHPNEPYDWKEATNNP